MYLIVLYDTFDAVVAGGSIAGVCAAAALSRRGWNVLLCEPGLADHRRLAGELMQAPAAAALDTLGLLAPLRAAGAVPVCGFAVCAPGEAPVVLSYGEAPSCGTTGLAIEHSVLARVLLERVRELPRVTTLAARVTSVSHLFDQRARLTIETRQGQRRVQARLIVAADGKSSKLRDLAGITIDKGPSFRMLGCRVEHALPWEGYGHVFLGGKRPVLAYRVSPQATRLMFEASGAFATTPDSSDLAALPASLSYAVQEAFTRGEGLSAVVHPIEPSRFASGRLVLAGDAGGAAHPVTATGVAFCANDALRLSRVLDATGEDVPRALALYDAERREPMRTRMLLASLLATSLGADAPAVRRGLMAYWRSDRRGRATSIQLLSTDEPRMSVLLREYMKVMGFAVGRSLAQEQGIMGRTRALYAVAEAGVDAALAFRA